MDWLTFYVEIFKAIAWPGAAVVISLLFREQLKVLLTRLKKGKVGPAEFEFEQSVKDLREEAPQLAQSAAGVGTPTIQLIASNPRAAILEAWLSVESATQNFVRSRGYSPPLASRKPLSTVRALEKERALSEEQLALYYELRDLRNQAAHDVDFSPSTDSVLSYVQLAKGLQETIQRVALAR